MTGQLHRSPHPDPELLNAFMEGVLPEHERLECVAHFAECSRCREIVFLAQPPTPIPIAPVKRRWLAPVRVLSGALAACVLIAALWLFRRQPPMRSEVPAISTQHAADVKPAQPAGGVVHDRVQEPTQVARTAGVKANRASPPRRAKVESAARVEPAAPSREKTPGVASGVVGGVAGGLFMPPPKPAPALQIAAQAQQIPSLALPAIPAGAPEIAAQIKGSVTDPAGAAISGATVTIRSIAGADHETTRTDADGRFTIAGLTAGRYELQIESMGFVRNSSQVELKPHDVAVVASRLEIGSMAQTVAVIGEASTINTAAAAKPPFATSVTSGTRILAVDSLGALHFSQNEGKHWKTIRAKWRGKVAQIVVLSADTEPVFQITTDSDEVWFSTDGSHWHPRN